ncbi:hypothetical protein DVR12_22960 [Chitinophaga silvatica]|uniref:TonB-dependent receptor n=1 Tax=Chitinophaga silvatica TaxID=2282649 RepID=A0A3E1Y489_9BACT|nr:hypothetical protein [Chitinophaga silvatica]RFS19498.1 hypothetical protein DVR12_22960 [Chitinophaga silvatica]
MKYLLALLLLPASILAQESKPVEHIKSDAYRHLIARDSASHYSFSASPDTFKIKRFPEMNGPIRRITYSGKSIDIHSQYPYQLRISGSYNSDIAIRAAGKQPGLQQSYSQGRSSSNGLLWQGPETNELFSYGPALNNLEYDGKPYLYDEKGSLVATGKGNGKTVVPYSNNVFRTATSISQNFNIMARLMNYNTLEHEFKLGFSNINEQTYIQSNNNALTAFNTSYLAKIKWLTVTAKYRRSTSSYSNSNNNGFLNRVFQDNILTPPSFDNSQGYTLNNGQRSYSKNANNPFYLLEDNDNYLRKNYQQASLLLQRNYYQKVKYSLLQSWENNTDKSKESYKPFSAYYPNGISFIREKRDKSYELNGAAEYSPKYTDGDFNSQLNFDYNLSNVQSNINISPYNNYHYQRTANESRFSFRTTYSPEYNNNVSLTVGNRTYFSNTTDQTFLFLPQVTLESNYKLATISNGDLMLSLNLGYSDVVSERLITQSYGYSNLTGTSVAAASSYFPVTEALSFDHLKASRYKDATAFFSVRHYKILDLGVNLYSKNIINQVAPILNGSQINLANIGNQNIKGLDISVSRDVTYSSNKFKTRHSLIFTTYKSKVTKADHNFLALNGFSDVHTTWIEGQPMNSIVGTAWIRDGNGNLVIGDDGYPMPQKSMQIIGDPNPEFILKYDNLIYYGRWSLGAILEWKKGGEQWNGTQAMMDYYGVSATSGAQRNVKGYVFQGVHTDGSPNNTPVDFYDPNASVYANRWVRYGPGGVGEAYIQKADWLRLNNIHLNYYFNFRKIIRKLETGIYARNILLWTPYKGVDPAQLLFDQPGTQGLDYFNLPGLKSIGINVSIQF